MLALRSAAIVVLATSIAACVTGPAVSGVDPGDFLHDDAFPEGAARVVESQDAIFRLDGAARDRRTISQSRVLAMFYSNKGVDALLGKNRAEAYAYFKAALREDPSLDMAMTNLGLLYRLNGHLEWAEDAFRHAMRLNPDNTVNAESLAGLLRNTGRENEASVLQARLERERSYNPYYQYIQGEEAYDAGNWSQAVAYFKRAIRLEADASEFHYGLAKAYSALGDEDRANAAVLLGEIRENDASGEERSRPCRPHRANPAYYFLPC